MLQYTAFTKLEKKYKASAIEHFNETLDAKGLKLQEIKGLPIDEINKKLALLNDILNDPKKFDITSIVYKEQIEDYMTGEKDVAEFGFNPNPFLNERKNRIIDILKYQTELEKFKNINSLVTEIKDNDIKEKITTEINDLHEQSKQIEGQRNKNLEETELKLKILERKSIIWKTFLEKEPIATLIGAFILLVFSISLIVGMFTKIENPDIIKNAFLIILGYFFGQSKIKK